MPRTPTKAKRLRLLPLLLLGLPGVLGIVAPLSAEQGGGVPALGAAGSVRVGPWQLAAEPVEPERGLRIFDRGGPVLLIEGARPLDLVLTGESLAPETPTLLGRVRVLTDTGELLVLDPAAYTLTRDPGGKRFAVRYRLDLAALRQPFQRLRLEGELSAPQPLRLATHRVDWALGREAEATAGPGPLRVSLAADREAPGGGSLTATCEWQLSGASLVPAPGGSTPAIVAGPVRLELRAGDGAPLPLLHTVAVDFPRGESVQRVQRSVWRLDGADRGVLTLAYPTLERERRPFVLDGVQLPGDAAPAVGRIAAQRIILGDGWDRAVPAAEEPDLPEAHPPHALLDTARGATLRFRLRLAGAAAGEGSINAAFSPREGRGWGGWRWFSGRTDAAGEAVFQNLRPGTYRVRVFFRPAASRGPLAEYRLPETQVTVAPRRELELPRTDLEPVR